MIGTKLFFIHLFFILGLTLGAITYRDYIKNKNISKRCDVIYHPICKIFEGKDEPCAYGVHHNVICPYVHKDKWKKSK